MRSLDQAAVDHVRRSGSSRPTHEASPSPLVRLAWFAALWAGGVLSVGIVAYGLRLVIK